MEGNSKTLITMKENIQLCLLYLAIIFPFSLFGQDESAMPVGAVIVINTEGKVSLSGKTESDQPTQPKVGEVLPQGRFIQTDEGAKATLLLSNGTLVTIQEKTKMKVGAFEQAPFESNGRKVSDLEGEPSTSTVDLDLDFGSMIVKTKKLNKGSSFNIHSPVGTAGVRGTEFQLAQSPGAGVQLDVTESTVAFTPPGGQPMPVTQGQGLDVSSTGQLSPRPVNPAVALNITATNLAATEVSADISMDTVSDAMTESAELSAESETDATGEPSEGEGDSKEDGGDGSEGETESGEGQESEPSEQPSEGESSANEQAEEGNAPITEESSTEAVAETAGETPPEEPIQPVETTEVATAESTEVSSAPMSDTLSSTAQVEPELKIEELIEQNPDAKQMQETGKKGASASELAKFPLNEKLLGIYREFPEEIQNSLLDLEFEVVERLLSAEGFGPALAEKFTGFSSEAQVLILGLEDAALITLLEQDIDEALILSAMSPERVELSASDNLPQESDSSEMGDDVLSLGDALRESGNSEVYGEILELAGGEWTEEWLRVAEVANILSSDLAISPTSLPESLVVSGSEALSNPFYEEISSLYDTLESDLVAAGSDLSVLGGNLITVDSGTYDLTDSLGDSSSIIIGASEAFEVSGNIEFTGPAEKRVLIMSGDSINPDSGTNVTSALSDLVVATREDVLLSDSRLESAREIAVRSLRDIELKQVSLLADSMVRVKAAQDLNVDGLELSQSLPSLIMEATTIRLSNVDFPAATQVQLNSLKGPIDGQYPNFGTAIPASEQLGRVNFLSNVKSGGNLLMDRTAFDQFGGNITIGKLP